MAATSQVRLLVWTFSRRSSRSPLRPTKLQLSARRAVLFPACWALIRNARLHALFASCPRGASAEILSYHGFCSEAPVDAFNL